MSIPDFEGDTYSTTQSGPIPAPLTLAEVRGIARQQVLSHAWESDQIAKGVPIVAMCDDRLSALVATIEWLAERAKLTLTECCDYCPDTTLDNCHANRCETAERDLRAWLGEA